jgi:hypothetical protein
VESGGQDELDVVRRSLIFWALAFACCFASIAHAQYFTENFDHIDSLWVRGWAQRNNSSPQGSTPFWFQGDTARFHAQSGADSAYVAVDYNSIGGAGSISNWLIMPAATFSNGDKITFWTRTVDSPLYPDRIQVRMSLNGSSINVGTTPGSVGDFTTVLTAINPNLTTTGYPHVWTRYTLVINGLPAPTAGRVAFRYIVGNGGPGGANSDYIGIDSVAYFQPPAGDLEITGIRPSEYTQIPEKQQDTTSLTARIHNYGHTPITNARVQVNVRNSSGTIVHTASSAWVPSLAIDGHDTVTIAAPASLLPDDYTVEYIAQHGGNDGDHSNDTLRDHFSITALTYARDNGAVVGDIGIGAQIGGYVGQMFRIHQAQNLDSVWVHVTKGYTGQPIAAVIWDMVGGVPNQIIGSTDTLVYTSDSAATYLLPVYQGPHELSPGDYAVTLVEFDSTLHVGLGGAVFTEGTTWMRWPTLPTPSNWAHVELFNLPAYERAMMIRLRMSGLPVGVEDLADSILFSAFPNPNAGRFVVELRGNGIKDVDFGLYDVMGRSAMAFREAGVGILRREVDLRGRAAGVYWVRAQCDGFDRWLKVIVR